MPHTELEVGGFGQTKESYENYVKKILEKLIDMMIQNSEYKFNWSEVNYLEMWWNDMSVSEQLK